MVAGEGDVVFVVTVENATAAGLTAVRSDIARAAGQVQSDVTSKFGSVGNMVKNVEEGFRRLGNTLVGAGGAAMGTFTLPLILGMRSLVAEGQEFETELYRVLSIFDDGKKPIQELRGELQQFAQALAITTQYSSTEVLQSMYRMGQAGYGLADIYKMLPSILELATAQQYDLEQTFNIVNAAMKSYQFEAADTEKVVNQLAGAATMYNLTMEDYGKGLKYIMGLSKTLNQDFSEMLMLFGLLTDRGKTGMQAGRVIRDSIADIIAPTKQNTEILAKHNLELYTNQEQINGAAHAYQAAKTKLEAMEQGYRSSNDELISVNAAILTYKERLEQAKRAGNAQDVAYLTRAVNDLTDAYQWMGLGRKADASAIAKQRAEMTELQGVYDETSIEGMVKFTDIIKQIADSEMTAGEIAKVFGKQSADSILMLVDAYRSNPNIFEEQSAAIRDSTEATKQAQIQTQSTAFQIKQLQEALRQVKQAGYEALAPVIATLNKFFQDNIDTIKLLVSEFIEGFVPAFQRGISIIEGLLGFFDNMDKGTRKMLFGIIAGGITFMAALGPVLLYGGSLAWATASLIKLGEGAWGTAVLIGNFLKIISSAIAAQNLYTTSIFGTTAMYEALAAESIVVNPSIVATGSAFGIVGTEAGAATGIVATFGATLLTIAPYLALVGVAAYLLYWAWKHDWYNMQDNVSEAATSINDDINNVIRPAIDHLKRDIGQIGQGSQSLLSGIFDADEFEITYGVGKLIGALGRAFFDAYEIFYGIGDAITGAIWAGLTGGDAKKAFTDTMNQYMEFDKMGNRFTAGWLEGWSRGDLTYNKNKNIEVTDEGMERRYDQQIAYNNELIKERKYKEGIENLQEGYYKVLWQTGDKIGEIKDDVKQTAIGYGDINDGIDSLQWKIINIPKDKTPLGTSKENKEKGTAAGTAQIEGYEDAINKLKEKGIINDETAAVMLDNAETLGMDIGDILGDETALSYLEKLNDPDFQQQIANALSGSVPIDVPALSALPPMTGKGAIGESRTQIGDYWYGLDQVNTAAAGAKSYDGEYPSLSELMKGMTPIGITPSAIKEETVGSVLPATPSNVVGDATASAPALAATTIQNQYNYNIHVAVNPKEIMTKEGVAACGEEIAQVVRDKLGADYRANEAT